MDDKKDLLMKIKKDIPDCTTSRQRLRSILSDYFPTEKQMINVILNAYDEDVEGRLKSSSDRTLSALQLVKMLKNDYGMTDGSAFMALESWCYLLGYEEIADALSLFAQSLNTNNQNAVPQLTEKKIHLLPGIYMAGYDFPAGVIKIEATRLLYGAERFYCAILKKGSNSNEIITNGNYQGQVILNIKPGQRLEINCGEVDLTPIPEVV